MSAELMKLLLAAAGGFTPGRFFEVQAGAAFAALPLDPARVVEVKNTRPGAVDIAVRRGATGATVVVPAGGADAFVVANAADLWVARLDGQAGLVTISGEVRS